MTNCLISDLGLIAYSEALELQRRLVCARKADAIADVLLFCEHPHVITQGRNGKRENLLASDDVLRQKGIEFFAASRGGDITYHGPGQIVGYPILNLGAIRRDVVWYVRTLEEAMIRATAEYGIKAVREPGKTGIWVADAGKRPVAEGRERGAPEEERPSGPQPSLPTSHAMPPDGSAGEKLGAIGVHLSRWVTSHGFAYNVSTDLRYFDLIVPCGIAGRKATSLEKLLGRPVAPEDVRPRIARHLAELFGLELDESTGKELLRKLEHAELELAVSA